MTEGTQALGAQPRVEALDVAFDYDDLSAAMLRLEMVARLHAGERERLFQLRATTARDVLDAWRLANGLLDDAIAQLDAVKARMLGRSNGVVNAVMIIEEHDAGRAT